MKYLDRNILPKFQERLDLAATDLNSMEDIYVEAINELAGRIYILTNMVPSEERSNYSEETSFILLDYLERFKEDSENMHKEINDLRGSYDTAIENIESKYLELEKRMNALDDAAARKEDVAVIYKRTVE